MRRQILALMFLVSILIPLPSQALLGPLQMCSVLSGQADASLPVLKHDAKKPSRVEDIVVLVDGKELRIFKDRSLVWNELLGQSVTLKLTLSNASTIKPKVKSEGFILRLLAQVQYMGSHWENDKDGTRIHIPAAAIKDGPNDTLMITYALTDRERQKLKNAKPKIKEYDQLIAMAFQGYTGTFQWNDEKNKLVSETINEWLFNTQRRAIIKPD